MNITLWRTTKRDNSTATPTSQPSWFTNKLEKTVTLKEPTDILNPVFNLNMDGHDGQNYLQAFGRYYWVTGIKSLHNNLWELTCRIDPLGSYRGHIQNTSAYVLYDSTANTEIPDNRLGVRTTPTTSQNTVEMPWNFASGNGSKFLAIEGDGQLVTDNKADSATGVYYVQDSDIDKIGMQFTVAELENCFSTAWGTDFPLSFQWSTSYGTLKTINDIMVAIQTCITNADIAGIIGMLCILFVTFPLFGLIFPLIDFVKGLIVGGDALKHVKSAYWLPFVFDNLGTSTPDVAIGSYVDHLPNARVVKSPFRTTIKNVTIPWQYSDWRNVQNTEIQLFIPLIGNINIPTSAVKGKSQLTIRMNCNLYSGQLSVRVQCGDVTLGSYGSNVSMPIFIGDSNPNAPAVANTIVNAGAMALGVATGTAMLTAGAIAGGIQSGLNCIQPISTSVGGIGGGAGSDLGSLIVCTTICHNTSDEPSDLLPIIGTPTNVLKQLNGSGFCQTLNAHMSMTAVTGESYPTDSEVQSVNGALNSGVFLE